MTDMHLSDEELSSRIDDVGDRLAADAHLRHCDACRRRLTELGDARQLLRRPVPAVSADERAAMVAAVVDEALAERANRQSLGGDAAGVPVPATPLRVRRSPSPRVVGGVAAALIVAALIAVPVAISSTSNTTGSSRASGARSTHNPEDHGGLSAAANAPARDLGAIGSTQQLRSALASYAVNGAAGSAAAGSNGAVPGQAGPQSVGTAASRSGAFAPTAAPPATGAARSATSDAVAGCLPPAEQEAKTSRGTTANPSLSFTATAVYRDTPALVFVFGPASGQGGASRPLAVVTALSGCRVLAQTTI